MDKSKIKQKNSALISYVYAAIIALLIIACAVVGGGCCDLLSRICTRLRCL